MGGAFTLVFLLALLIVPTAIVEGIIEFDRYLRKRREDKWIVKRYRMTHTI